MNTDLEQQMSNLEIDNTNIHICILDTETTGLPSKGNDFSKVNMTELAYIIVDIDFNIIKEKNFLIKGDYEIPEIITQLTGITKELTDKFGIPLSKAAHEFYRDLKFCEFIVAHNLRFDYGMIKKEFKSLENKYYVEELCSKIQMCSLQMFRKEFPKTETGIENHKLQTIYNHLHETPYIQTHRALDDVMMIRSCMLKTTNFNLINQFWNDKINIGKYKNMTHREVLKRDHAYFRNFYLKKVHKFRPSKMKQLFRFL